MLFDKNDYRLLFGYYLHINILVKDLSILLIKILFFRHFKLNYIKVLFKNKKLCYYNNYMLLFLLILFNDCILLHINNISFMAALI